jgi:hypothetical protein
MDSACLAEPPEETHIRADDNLPAFSIYHEPWWLDIATDGQWSEQVVEIGGAIARLRYPLQLSNGGLISRMPTLVRTLGPEFFGLRGKRVTMERRKLALAGRLIDRLSEISYFEHVFDPRVADAAMFVRRRDFGVTLHYAYRASAGLSEEESWSRMTDKVRNHVRTASRQFQVCTTTDADLFCDFHDRCLRGQPNGHGLDRMRHLVRTILMRGAGQILAAVDDRGSLIAALLVVWDSDAVRSLIAARDTQRSGGGALSLLMHHAMRIATERGVAFDFDGAGTPGQLSFLSGFGADLVQRLVVWRTLPGYVHPTVRVGPRVPA